VKQVLAGKSPAKVKEQNLQAFDAGGSMVQEALRKA
jgi:Pyruvate/2-oxoacid:ferredoxin oxidoreductase gamma subunit